jgi:hypothetical protein
VLPSWSASTASAAAAETGKINPFILSAGFRFAKAEVEGHGGFHEASVGMGKPVFECYFKTRTHVQCAALHAWFDYTPLRFVALTMTAVLLRCDVLTMTLRFGENDFCDGLQLHVGCALVNLADLGVAVELFDGVFLHKPVTAVYIDRH